MPNRLERAAYAAGQAAKVAWYAGHHILARRMGGPPTAARAPEIKISAQPTSRRAMLQSIRDLFVQDWANIDAGLYRAPDALPSDPRKLLSRARAFLLDVPRVQTRRRERGHDEVVTDERLQKYPRYYLQNFHYQTDGWLSNESARIYDFQVETLFAGTADAMRRQALAPIARHLKDRDQRMIHLLDVASGTGRFLREVKINWPRLNVTALDLSHEYLSEARRNLRPWPATRTVEANAELMPMEAESQDIVTCIFLFHELPPKVRPVVAREIARVLKPGGLFVLVDSIQPRDARGFDSLMEMFPQAVHEPYYASYLTWSARDEFSKAGLQHLEVIPAFLSTVHVFAKPAKGETK
jgi:ubiquinone/menaquinone biosynthesis C-methylase UbiE